MRDQHQALQDRLVFGAVQQREPTRLTDYQTARLYQDDGSWSTRGTPIGRPPSPSYREGGSRGRQLTNQQWRDYLADLHTCVVLRLDPAGAAPTLDDLAAALDRPARPLCVGRKACLPAARLFAGLVTAPDARTALRAILPLEAGERPAVWPASEGTEGSSRTTDMTDDRNWISGLHGGARHLWRGLVVSAGAGGGRMTTQLVHVALDISALRRWARARGLVGRAPFDAGYSLHVLLSAMFGKGTLQPFRAFGSARRCVAALYAYAETDAAALQQVAFEVGTPDCLAVLDLGDGVRLATEDR